MSRCTRWICRRSLRWKGPCRPPRWGRRTPPWTPGEAGRPTEMVDQFSLHCLLAPALHWRRIISSLFKMFINSYLPLMTMFHNRRHLSLVHRVEILGKNRFKYSVELIFANISEEEWWAFILWFKIKSVSKSVCNTFQVIIVHQSHIKQILPRDFLSEWCFSGLWSQASNWRPH